MTNTLFEKVNPGHPDKMADRIAGAIVDYAYNIKQDPKCSVEVLIAHGHCTISAETDVHLPYGEVLAIVRRIAGPKMQLHLYQSPQDIHLAENQKDTVRCGDNGIFRGMPVSEEEKELAYIANKIYGRYCTDGKYILTDDKLIICQSNAHIKNILAMLACYDIEKHVNPLGFWTGGTDVDSGCTNRKLGSDMGRAVTGGGLHGKDLSKADVTVNIYCHMLAQILDTEVVAYCAIGDDTVTVQFDNISRNVSYKKMVYVVKKYIKENYEGSFEKLAEWGLIKPNNIE